MRGARQFLCLRPGEGGVGHHDDQGRVRLPYLVGLPPSALRTRGRQTFRRPGVHGGFRDRGVQPAGPEFVTHLRPGSVECAGGRVHERAGGVHGGEGRDGRSGRKDDARGAETAFHATGHRARAGPHASLGDGRALITGGRPVDGLLSQLRPRPGRPDTSPPQVEKGCGGHDRHHLGRAGTHAETPAPLLQPGGHAGRRVEAEGAASGQHHGVDPGHQVARVQGVGLPGSRPAAAHVDRRDHSVLRGEDRGDTGQPAVPGARGVPDPDPGHVRQRVARSDARCRSGCPHPAHPLSPVLSPASTAPVRAAVPCT